jgi:hypothetical protein
MMIIDDSDYADTAMWVFVSDKKPVFILVCNLINFTDTVTKIRKYYCIGYVNYTTSRKVAG